MGTTGAQALIRTLENLGVEVIFGYPGGAVLPIYTSLLDSTIHHVLVRNEQGSAHAASGYARATGKPGVCLATSGPGATNLVTGLATAYMDSISVVAITGQVATSMIGTDAFQEVDITGITMPITKHNYLVKNVDDLPRIIQEAFHIASTGRPGPVLVDIPKDIADALCKDQGRDRVDLPGYRPTFKGHPAQIKNACRLIREAKKPVLFVGGGVLRAGGYEELLTLAQKANIPVATAFMGISAFPETHPLSLGLMGMHGTPWANLAISECDLLIGLAVRFGDRSTGTVNNFAKKAKIIHIDVDPAEIGKNARVDLPIVGDARAVLSEMARLVDEKRHPEWLATIDEWKVKKSLRYREDALTAQYVLEVLGDKTRDKGVYVTTDVGQHQMWTAQHYKFNVPNRFISSGGLGTMGYGLPAAVGVQMAKKDELVFVITGDGSFQMQMQELGTAMQEKLPIKVILFNNSMLGMVKQLQYFYSGKRYSGVQMTFNPDFVKLAEAYEAKGMRITEKSEVDGALDEIINHPGLVIAEFVTDSRNLVYPMVLGGKGIDEMILYE